MAGNTDKVLLGRTTNHEGKKSEIILLGIFNVVCLLWSSVFFRVSVDIARPQTFTTNFRQT